MLKRVTEWAVQGQLYLERLRRDHPGWSTACHQEWGLFLLECLLHNAAAMQRKEWKEPQEGAPKVNQLRWLEWASKKDQCQLDPLHRAGDALSADHPHGFSLPWLGLEGPRQPSG